MKSASVLVCQLPENAVEISAVWKVRDPHELPRNLSPESPELDWPGDYNYSSDLPHSEQLAPEYLIGFFGICP